MTTANGVSDTVGGKAITVPVKETAARRPGQMVKPPLLHLPQAAVPPLSLTDDAILDAQSASTTTLDARRVLRQLEESSTRRVGVVGNGECLLRPLADTPHADSQLSGDEP